MCEMWRRISSEIRCRSACQAVACGWQDPSERARSYVGKIKAVSGQGGHDDAFRVAKTLVNDFALDPDFAETPAGRDPLGASVASFLLAVRGQAPRPVVTAEEAIRTLHLALAVEQAAKQATPA